MLRLTMKPGEYLLIGENIKVVFTGGSANNMHVMVDAPKSLPIARSKVVEKNGGPLNQELKKTYYKDRKPSKESVDKIIAILMEDKRNVNDEETTL